MFISNFICTPTWISAFSHAQLIQEFSQPLLEPPLALQCCDPEKLYQLPCRSLCNLIKCVFEHLVVYTT